MDYTVEYKKEHDLTCSEDYKKFSEWLINKLNASREKVLLKATLDIFKQQENSSYTISCLETTAIWDDVECDGSCLMEEIEILLSETA